VPVPGARWTNIFGINARGDIVGAFGDKDLVQHGFLLPAYGAFTVIDGPSSTDHGPPPNGTFAQSINARGDMVGTFFDGSVHGFLISGDIVTQLDVPFPGAFNTNAPGSNDRGDIVGFYTVSGRQVAFRRDRHGNYESLDAPTSTQASSTLAIGINAPGDIVGQYTHVGVTRGFVMYRTPTP
jgi:hypothetical protein